LGLKEDLQQASGAHLDLLSQQITILGDIPLWFQILCHGSSATLILKLQFQHLSIGF